MEAPKRKFKNTLSENNHKKPMEWDFRGDSVADSKHPMQEAQVQSVG